MNATHRSYRVPGRIEFLGKHTDYAGGRSLVCAIERGITLRVSPRADSRIGITDRTSGVSAEFEISATLSPPSGHWTAYPMTVARRLARDFPRRWRGVDIEFTSDLPQRAGLASSSALVVGCYVAVAEVNDLAMGESGAPPFHMGQAGAPPFHVGEACAPPFHAANELAGYLGAVESGTAFGDLAGDEGVGTHGGSEDHVAILCSRPGELGQYAYAPVRHERQVALPRDHRLVVAVSGVAAPKTGAAREGYNRTSHQIATLLARWRRARDPQEVSLAAALRSSPEAFAELHDLVKDDPALSRRLEQFTAESDEIIPAAGDALLGRDLAALGELVDRSQALAERCLGNQIPETTFLARSARELGAVAASAFGAGFGGSVWALVLETNAEDFRRRWAAAYGKAFPGRGQDAQFFLTRAGPAVQRF